MDEKPIPRKRKNIFFSFHVTLYETSEGITNEKYIEGNFVQDEALHDNAERAFYSMDGKAILALHDA